MSERKRIASALWRLNNPEAQRAANRRYYLKHRKALIFQQQCRNAGVRVPSIREYYEMTGASLAGKRKVLRLAVWYKSVWGRVPTTYAKAKNPKGKVTRAEIHLECGHVINLPLHRIESRKFNCPECVAKLNDPSKLN